MSNFYVTFTGEKVTPENLGSLKINLIDIAHHLTNIQRFGGALPFDKSYTVAEHCVLLADYALDLYGPSAARLALLHDATEAYLGDVVSSLKASLPDYQKLECQLESLIYEKYSIDMQYAKEVKQIDTRILLDEVAALMPDKLSVFTELYPNLKPLGVHINGEREAEKTYLNYLNMCNRLEIIDKIGHTRRIAP